MGQCCRTRAVAIPKKQIGGEEESKEMFKTKAPPLPTNQQISSFSCPVVAEKNAWPIISKFRDPGVLHEILGSKDVDHCFWQWRRGCG